MASILLVEDDPTIGRVLTSSLQIHGHLVNLACTGSEALDAARAVDFDLVLLDLGLPDMDGIDLCRRLRMDSQSCVLVVLTARDEEIDVVVGLEAGADDYLTKPFRLAELLARVQAHLRRGPGDAPGRVPASTRQFGDLEIDTAARTAKFAGAEMKLRSKEFDLLDRLAAQPGVAISRDRLMADVWDAHWYGSTKTLDVHVAALRRKMAAAADETGGSSPVIITLRAHGFRFEPPGGR